MIERQRADAAHRLGRVEHEVEHDLPERTGLDGDGRQRRIVLAHHGDLAQMAGAQLERRRRPAPRGAPARVRAAPSIGVGGGREARQILRDGERAAAALADGVEQRAEVAAHVAQLVVGERGVALEPLGDGARDRLGVRAHLGDAGVHAAHLVGQIGGDAADDLAERRQLLRLHQALLGAAQIAQRLGRARPGAPRPSPPARRAGRAAARTGAPRPAPR